jgi:hypothetical protein
MEADGGGPSMMDPFVIGADTLRGGGMPLGEALGSFADWALRQTNTELDNMDIDAARAARDKAIQQAQSRSSIPLVIPLPVSPGVAAGLTIAGAILGGGLGGGGSTSSPSTGTQTTTGTEPETTGTGGQAERLPTVLRLPLSKPIRMRQTAIC